MKTIKILTLAVLVAGFVVTTRGRAEIKVDVGGQAAPAEPGWVEWITPGRLGDVSLSQSFVADFGDNFNDEFTVVFDKVDTRLRNAVNAAVPLARMLASSFKDNTPIVMRVQGLDAGAYEMTMWHHDGNVNAKPTLDILVTDAEGADRLVVDDLAQSWGGGPVFSTDASGRPLGPAEPAVSKFLFHSDGMSEVFITLRDNDDVQALYSPFAQNNPDWNETFIAGFQIVSAQGGTGVPPRVTRLVAQPFGFDILITQTPPRLVDTNSVRVRLDGTQVPVRILTADERVTVEHRSAAIYPSGVSLPVEITFSDTGTPPTNQVVGLTYQVPVYRVLAPSQALPSGSIDTNSSGFNVRVHQTRWDATLAQNLARAEDQIRGRLIDPTTGEPYLNHATGGGAFADENVINWDLQGVGSGNFTWMNEYPDEPFPGLPGDEGSSENAASEIIGYVALNTGLHTLGVNSDDGFRLTAGAAPQDLQAPELAAFDGTRGAADTTVLIYVQAAGIYPLRLLHFQAAQNASVEFFSVDSDTNKWLLNDRAKPAALKVYRTYTGAPLPYLDYASPVNNATRVPLDTAIEARVINLGATPAKMFLNGIEVPLTRQTSGDTTTLRHQPATPLAAGTRYEVGLILGARSNVWSFLTLRGPKIALIVGNPDALNASDTGVKARLESYGFEVYVYDDSASQPADVEDSVLAITSATVSSGNVGGKFTSITVPVLNWEVNIQDDYLMTLATSGTDLGETPGQTNLIITLPEHPIAAGLPAGSLTVVRPAQTFTWGVPNPVTADVIATMDDGTARPCLYAYEVGDAFSDQSTPAPARRVHIFMQENAFASLTEAGLKLFDAAASWAMDRPLIQPPARLDSPTWQSGQLQISWTGPGTLQSAEQIHGPWTDVPNATNPWLTDATRPTRFFRLRQ